MTISHRATGTHTSASAAVGSVNPAVPAGGQPGDIAILFVQGKGSTAGVAPTITTPGGWTLIGTVTNNGTLVAGTDTGSNTVAVYYDVGAAAGAIGNITATGFNSLGAVIHIFATDLTNGGWDVAQSTTGSDTSSGADISITGAGGISVASGDWVIGCGGASGDVGTLSAQTVAGMSGATLGTAAVETNAAVTTGTDCRTVVVSRPVSSGSSSAAPTMTWTNASSTTAHARIFRLREVAAADTTVARFALSDPGSVDDTLGDVTLRVRAQTDTGVGGLDTDLYSGGSLVQSFVDSTTTSWQTFTHIVTNAISDYTALEVRLTGNAVPGTQTRVSWLELEVPEGTGGTTWNIDGTLTATGTLTAATAETKPVNAALSGTGTLTAATTETKPVNATLTATGTLTAALTVVPAGKSIDGTLTATGTLSAAAAVVKPVTGSTLTATVSPTAAATVTKPVDAALAGTGTLTASLSVTKPVDASLSGTGTLTAAASAAKPINGTLTGTGTLAAATVETKPIDGALTATGTLTAAADIPGTGKSLDAALTATGTLSAALTVTKPVQGSLSGTGTLTASATETKPIQGALSGTGTLAADITKVAPGKNLDGTLTATGTLTSAATVAKPVGAALTATGSLAASLTVTKPIQAALTALATLEATAELVLLTSPGQMHHADALSATMGASAATGAGMVPRPLPGPQMARNDLAGSAMKGS